MYGGCYGAPPRAVERKKSERLQQPYIEDDVIGKYLFDNKFIEDTKRTLHTFSKIREKKMKEKEDSERDSHAVKTVQTVITQNQ